MKISRPAVMKDPRYIEATRLFDAWDWGWGIPSDPHARDNLRHACGLIAASDDDDFLELVLTRYLGDKYRNTVRQEVKRIARSAARTGGKDA